VLICKDVAILEEYSRASSTRNLTGLPPATIAPEAIHGVIKHLIDLSARRIDGDHGGSSELYGSHNGFFGCIIWSSSNGT
jgi:hypothetical protein